MSSYLIAEIQSFTKSVEGHATINWAIVAIEEVFYQKNREFHESCPNVDMKTCLHVFCYVVQYDSWNQCKFKLVVPYMIFQFNMNSITIFKGIVNSICFTVKEKLMLNNRVNPFFDKPTSMQIEKFSSQLIELYMYILNTEAISCKNIKSTRFCIQKWG